MVRMADKETRRIHQLSGGERQRVALARALVTRPAILLLDEPLGALDEKLRFEMQSELVELHRSLGMTFVYITHSQEEALTMSDRVDPDAQGAHRAERHARELFDRPVSRFVAEFMGFENVLPARGRDGGATRRVVARVGGVGDPRPVDRAKPPPSRAPRPWSPFAPSGWRRPRGTQPGSDRENSLPATPGERIYRGKYVDQTADTPVGPLKVRIWDRTVHDRRFRRRDLECRRLRRAAGLASPATESRLQRRGRYRMSKFQGTYSQLELVRRDFLKALAAAGAPRRRCRRRSAPARRPRPIRWSAATA